MIWYFPLEHIDSRYTTHLDRDICKYLDDNGIQYTRIAPDQAEPLAVLPPGQFLDAAFTSRFKAQQLAMISEQFELGNVCDGDVMFFSDIWFPGIESIAYIQHFTGIKVKIQGILHAGSFTDTDEVRKLERWAKQFEEVVFDIADTIYVASNFIKQDVISKRMIHPDKVVITPLPLAHSLLESIETSRSSSSKREPIVVFNGRNHPEKQPNLWSQLKIDLMEKWYQHTSVECPFKFVWTQQEGLTKSEYFKLLTKSKVVVSFALQENFGFGIAEASVLGCIPVVPNRLVYPEMYIEECLYDRYDQAVDMVFKLLIGDGYDTFKYKNKYNVFKDVKLLDTTSTFNTWFSNIKQ
jgi:glycosyltransferase involved in cell wall biosynthesis